MSSQVPQAGPRISHVLVVSTREQDGPALSAALPGIDVRVVPDAARAREVVTSGEPVGALVIAAEGEPGPVEPWLELTDGRPIGLVALLVQSTTPAAMVRWVEGGGHGWVFRERLEVLPALLVRIARSQQENAAREDYERRLRATTAELVALARSPRFRGDDLDAALREITETGTRWLEVTRCSVWLFDELQTTLRMVDQFDVRGRDHRTGQALSSEQHRGYFSVLASQRLIAATDAQHDPRTMGFNSDYHVPEGITSTLDVGVRLRGELVGVLCFELVGPQRRWSAAEEFFAGALADVVSLALEGAERYRVEAALRHSELRFRELFQHASDAIVLYRVALDGTVYCEDINRAAEVSTGLRRDEVLGRRVDEVLDPQSSKGMVESYAEVVRTREHRRVERNIRVPNGERWYDTSVVPMFDEAGRVHRLAAIARDITIQRENQGLQTKLEAELAEAQKNEALARLASHIAHDVNNLLTVIIAHAERLTQLPGKPAEVAQAILQVTGRGRDLTQQVMTFGRRRPPERKSLELGPIVRETTGLLEPTAPAITWRLDLPLRSTRVLGDAGQLHQVVTNLCTNALAAMSGAPGALTVRLSTVELDYAFARAHPPLQAGRWVVLAVEDTGEGMDEATRRRIFEPFFSARADRRGNGLGLAVVQSIVQGHGGAVLVETAPGQGSTFRVYLPALEQEASRPGTGQHLMLVDDHPSMARVSAKLLETLGYRTSVFDDPREALAAFQATPTGFDAVLTDLSMPQMSGEEFTRSVRQVSVTVPIILSSGMASELDADDLQRLGVQGVLMKPWRLEEAVATLQRVLP